MTSVSSPCVRRSAVAFNDPIALLLVATLAVVTLVLHMSDSSTRLTMQLLASGSTLVALLSVARCHRQTRRAPRVGLLILHAAMMFWFYVPALATSFSPSQWALAFPRASISNSSALQALALASIFYFFSVLAYAMARPRVLALRSVEWVGGRLAVHSARSLNLFLMAVFACGFGVYAALSGGPVQALTYVLTSRSGTKPWSASGNFGTELTPAIYLGRSLILLAASISVALVLMPRHGWASGPPLSSARRWLLLAVAISALGLTAIDSGTRTILIQASLPVMLMYYLRLRRHVARGLSSHYFLLLVICGTLLISAGSQFTYRNTGSVDPVAGLRLRDNDFVSELSLATEVRRLEGRDLGGSVLVALATGPVPSSLWDGKAVPEWMVVYSSYRFGVDILEKGGNALPSIVGQFYLKEGILGVLLIGLVLGALARLIDLGLEASGDSPWPIYTYLSLLTFLFVSYRAMSFGFFFPVELLIAALVILRLARGAVTSAASESSQSVFPRQVAIRRHDQAVASPQGPS